MSDPGAWADVAGPMEATCALWCRSNGAPGLTGSLVLTMRADFYHAVERMFADPECNADTIALVRKHLSGIPI